MNNRRVVSQPGMIVSGHNLEMLIRRLCSRKNTDDKIEIENARRLWEIVITNGKFSLSHQVTCK